MSDPPNSVLDPFLEVLHAHRFPVGLDRRLRVAQAFGAWQGRFPPHRLCTLLCPIFATTAEEQRLFYELFGEHFPHISNVDPGARARASHVWTATSHPVENGHVTCEPNAEEPIIEPAPINTGFRRQSIRLATFSFLALALIASGTWYLNRPSQPHVGAGPVTPADLQRKDTPAPMQRKVDVVKDIPVNPVELDRRLNPVPTTLWAKAVGWLKDWWQSLLLLLPLLLWLWAELWTWLRRRAVLAPGGDQPPGTTAFGSLVLPVQTVARAGFSATLRRLRQPEAGLSRLNLSKTIASTVRAAGFPEFRYEPVFRRPEYLVLIDRASARDHQATFFEELAAALDRAGLRVGAYVFSGDPRVCRNARTGRSIYLADLVSQTTDHRLIVFCGGDSLLFESGDLTPGATILLRWRQRALLTPREPRDWGRAEWHLARHFLVLPATTAMLAAAVDYFGPDRRTRQRWAGLEFKQQDLNLDHATTAEIRRLLGNDVYTWLCACALYPHLQWDITIQLGRKLNPFLLNETNLERLVQLPWFRRGAIPTKLQQSLAESLDKSTRLRLRAAILEILEQASSSASATSAVSDAHRLEIAIQRLDILPKDRRRILDDEAVARVVAEADMSPLAVRISPELSRALFPHGLPALGLRTPTRRAFAFAGVLGLGGAVLQRVEEAIQQGTVADPPLPRPPSPGKGVNGVPIPAKPVSRPSGGSNPNALPIVDPGRVAQILIANQKAIADEVRRATDDPLRQAQLRNSFSNIADQLGNVTNSDRVMTTLGSMGSVLQSFIAEKAKQAGQVEMLEDGPVARFSDTDVLEWIKSGFVAFFEGQYKFAWKTAPDDPDPLKRDDGHFRVALFGNWGTGAYGAPIIADSIRNDPDGFDMVLHLGDTYYSGQAEEIKRQLVDAFPYRTDALNRSLSGNRDMYSGGKPYLEAILGGKFQQRATHFYIQNRDWVLVGLDTAYVDHDLPVEEDAWFSRIMAQAGKRKVVLFSHHQPFSLLDVGGPNLVSKLREFLKDKRIFAWYWAHETRCVVYDQHPEWGIFGRCVGHGGFPHPRDILGPVAKDETWKVLRGSDDSPGGAVLDGPNPYVKANPNGYGPHGYMSLIFDKDQMREFVHRADGVTIYTRPLAAAAGASAAMF